MNPLPPPRFLRRHAGAAMAALLGAFFASAACSGFAAQAGPAQAPVRAALEQMLSQADVIFSGEVFAVRRPGEARGESGEPNPRQSEEERQAASVRFTVNQGIRNANTGGEFDLRLSPEQWQQVAGELGEHRRILVLISAPDAQGRRRIVGGAKGILPVDDHYTVDLSGLGAPGASAQGAGAGLGTGPGQSGGTADAAVPDYAAGSMPELEQKSISYLALVRDIFILTSRPGSPAAGTEPAAGAKPGASTPAATPGPAPPAPGKN